MRCLNKSNEIKEVQLIERIKFLRKKINDLKMNYTNVLPFFFESYQNHLIDIIPFIDIPDNDYFYMKDIVTGAYLTNVKEQDKDQNYEQLSFDQDCQTMKPKKTRSKYRENEYYKYC